MRCIENAQVTKTTPKSCDALIEFSVINTSSIILTPSRLKFRIVRAQHYVAGGCTHCFTDKGFEFDTGAPRPAPPQPVLCCSSLSTLHTGSGRKMPAICHGKLTGVWRSDFTLES